MNKTHRVKEELQTALLTSRRTLRNATFSIIFLLEKVNTFDCENPIEFNDSLTKHMIKVGKANELLLQALFRPIIKVLNENNVSSETSFEKDELIKLLDDFLVIDTRKVPVVEIEIEKEKEQEDAN